MMAESTDKGAEIKTEIMERQTERKNAASVFGLYEICGCGSGGGGGGA